MQSFTVPTGATWATGATNVKNRIQENFLPYIDVYGGRNGTILSGCGWNHITAYTNMSTDPVELKSSKFLYGSDSQATELQSTKPKLEYLLHNNSLLLLRVEELKVMYK